MVYFFYLMILFILVLAVGILLNKAEQKKKITFSIIIPFKNEEHNLPALFSALDNLDYDEEAFEIILVDDNSVDNSVQLAEKYCEHKHNAKCLQLQDSKGKKSAMELGVINSACEFLLFSDADCQPPPDWLTDHTRFIDDKTGMVVGFKTQKDASAFTLFILNASAAIYMATIGFRLPFCACGSNLAVRKKSFEEVGGFSGLRHHAAGDDLLLVNLIKKTDWKVKYNYFAGVNTLPLSSNHYDQHKRKYSKLHMYTFGYLFLSFVLLLFFITMPIYVFVHGDYTILISYVLSLWIVWSVFLIKHKLRTYLSHYLYLIFYPYYIIVIIALGYLTGWKWK